MSDEQERGEYQGPGHHISDDGEPARGSTVSQHGGALRVDAGGAHARLKALAEADRAQAEGRLKTDSRALVRTQVHSRQPTQATPAAFRVTSAASSRVLPTDEIRGDSLVHMGSQEVSVSIAESVGLITRGTDGSVKLTAKGAKWGGLEDGKVPAAAAPRTASPDVIPNTVPEVIAKALKVPGASQGEPAQTDATPDAKSEDAAITRAEQAMAGVPGEVVASVMARVVENSIDVDELARSLGVSAEEAGKRFSTIADGYQAEANAHLRAQGIDDPHGFRAWAEGQRIEEFQGAVTQHLLGDLSGYDSLAARFVQLDTALSQKGALDGFDGKHEIGGETVTVYTVKGISYLDHPKVGKMTLRQAVLSGLVERDD